MKVSGSSGGVVVQVQVPEGHPNLVQPDLFALGLEFLIQHPVSRRGVLQRRLAHLLIQCAVVLLLGTACQRAVLVVPQPPVRHAGVLGEAAQAELGVALPQDDQVVHGQSRRTFREMSSSNSFSATMRLRRSFSRSGMVTP